MHQFARNNQQSGIALVVVLLVVALAATAAIAMSRANHLDIQRTGNRLAIQQARHLASGAELWAAAILRERREQSPDGEVDARHQPWAQPLPPMPVHGGSVSGRIVDLQGRLNLNNLVDAETGQIDSASLARLERLLDVLGLDIAMGRELAEWMSNPSARMVSHHAGLEPPYAPAGQLLADTGELRLLRGMSTNAWHKLRAHVTALPQNTPVNVNTASPAVLQAVVPGLTRVAAEQIVNEAGDAPFASTRDFVRDPLIRATLETQTERELLLRGVSVRSRYFRAQGRIELAGLHYDRNAWLHIDENTGETRVFRRSRLLE